MKSKIYWSTVVMWFAAALLFVMCFGSCKTKIPVKEITKSEKKSSDSLIIVELIEKNKAINDRYFKAIGSVRTSNPNCDSITRAYLIEFLKGLNMYKTSGENSWGFRFDELNDRFEAFANIAETTSWSKDTDHRNSDSSEIETAKEVPIKWMPWYIIALAGIGGAAVIYILYRISRIFIPTKPVIS